MQFLKATFRISFVLFFCWISLNVAAQTATELTKYQNDKYRFSFSYPTQFLLEVVNDDEWIIRKADRTWAIGFKIIHLQGRSFDNYVNGLAANLYTTLATGYGLSNTTGGKPEINPYGKYLLSGFDFGLYISGSLGGGSGLDQLTKSWNLYLNIFRKTTQPGFAADGILIYDFRQPLDTDNHKLTKLVIKSFEQTMLFKEVAVTKPVLPAPVVKKPIATNPTVKTNPIAKGNKPVPKAITGKFTDSRKGGGTYHTIKIGTQTWMSENLDVSTFLNGDPIPEAKTVEEWKYAGANRKPAWCYFNNDDEKGKLYNWFAVNDPRGLAPKGWRIPSREDWVKMITYLGGDDKAPNKLIDGLGWKRNIRGTLESGFAGLPCKWRTGEGVFTDTFESACWWTSSYKNYIDAATLYTLYDADGISSMDIMAQGSDKKLGASVRCVKN